MGMGESSFPKVTDNQTVTSPQGPIIFIWDGTNAQAVLGDSSGKIWIANTQFDAAIVGGNVGFSPDTDGPDHSAVSIATTNTTAAGAPSSGLTRKYIMIQNISDTTIWIKLDGSPAIVNEGIELLSKGSYEVITPMPISQNSVTAIHNSTGSKTVLVTVVDAL